MIIETWKRHGDRILPAWCDWSDEDERKVKPSQKRFSCLRKPDAVAKRLEEVFTAEEISEIVALLTLKY